VPLKWEPFLLGPIFKSFGWETSPFVLQEQKGRYMWRDMERQCEKYGLPWKRPTNFPRRALLPMRVAVLGKDAVWIEAFSRRMMALNFVEDREIDSVEEVSRVLLELGLDAGAIIEQAQDAQNKERLKDQTLRAQALGVFGGPTFFVEGEMFWGNDRLDEAVEWAARA
jgi:2-hydroxychromene-2-carboxylate isomerase